MRMQKLTAKQEKFAQAIALDNMSQADAYRAAYDTGKMSEKSIWERASVEANKIKVATRINELRQEAMTDKVMSAQKRREKLTALAESEDAVVAMKAIDLLNKMDGEYVQKLQAEVQTETTINIELVDDDAG